MSERASERVLCYLCHSIFPEPRTQEEDLAIGRAGKWTREGVGGRLGARIPCRPDVYPLCFASVVDGRSPRGLQVL